MKTFGVLLALGIWCFVGYSFLHQEKHFPAPVQSDHVYAAPEPEMPKKIERTKTYGPAVGGRMAAVGGGTAYVPEFVQLGTDEPRKFSIHIKEVVPGKGTVASGAFYDLPPEATTNPERLDTSERKWTQCGKILVVNLPSVIDGQEWKGWLLRVGVETVSSPNGPNSTMPSYRVIEEPPFAAYKAPAGDWQKRFGAALDKAPHR
jgi:hypothetical protein